MPTAAGGVGSEALTIHRQSTSPDPVFASSRLKRLIRRATSWLRASEGDLGADQRRAGFTALEAAELTRVPRDPAVRAHGYGAVLKPWSTRGPPERPPPTSAGAGGEVSERCRGPPGSEIDHRFHERSPLPEKKVL